MVQGARRGTRGAIERHRIVLNRSRVDPVFLSAVGLAMLLHAVLVLGWLRTDRAGSMAVVGPAAARMTLRWLGDVGDAGPGSTAGLERGSSRGRETPPSPEGVAVDKRADANRAAPLRPVDASPRHPDSEFGRGAEPIGVGVGVGVGVGIGVGMPAEHFAPAAEPPASLDLDLPPSAARRQDAPGARPPSVRDQALTDPRANRALTTREGRLAQSLGTDDTIQEESRGDGRRRIRQGRDCVDLRPQRAAELDPFNTAVRPAPMLAEGCGPK